MLQYKQFECEDKGHSDAEICHLTLKGGKNYVTPAL